MKDMRGTRPWHAYSLILKVAKEEKRILLKCTDSEGKSNSSSVLNDELFEYYQSVVGMMNWFFSQHQALYSIRCQEIAMQDHLTQQNGVQHIQQMARPPDDSTLYERCGGSRQN